jgi:hypothetical protein
MNYLDWATMDWGFGGVYPGAWDGELWRWMKTKN